MTPSDTRAFSKIYHRLAGTLQRYGPLTEDVIDATFDVLNQYPLAVVDQAATWLTKRTQTFPTPSTWAEVCETLAPSGLPAPAITPVPDGVVCARCEDTGWVLGLSCASTECGRQRPHAPHTYTEPCPCRATNPYWQANTRELQRENDDRRKAKG